MPAVAPDNRRAFAKKAASMISHRAEQLRIYTVTITTSLTVGRRVLAAALGIYIKALAVGANG
jgi:hypothetical protein